MALTVLKKALPQDRYIKITSSTIGTPEISDRDFGGLVFTETNTIIVNGTSREFAMDKMIEVYNAEQARKYFGSEADETEVAVQYFGYRSPRGFSPRRLCFVRKDTNESPVDALVRINGLTNNFGGFMFLDSEKFTVSQMEAVVSKVHELDYRYEFGLAFPSEVAASDEPASGSATIANTNARDFVLKLANGETLPAYTGTSVWLGHKVAEAEDDEESDVPVNSAIAAIMPLAIFGSVRYSGTNTVTNYMFKQFPSQKYTVDDDIEADEYDALCVNYIGLVQANGDRKAFTQQGFNINGEAINTYCNEVWLKSEVATAILNLFLDTEVVSADEDGELLIYNTIASVALRAKNNGAISVGKTLDEAQKSAVYQITQDNEAWRTVQNAGYYLTVDIRRVPESGRTFYKAYYLLVYSKDDAILKVEGQHALV